MKFSLQPGSIKTRVTLSALAVFLLSLWLLSFLTTRILEKDISQLVSAAQASAAIQMASQLERELGSRLAALEQIAAKINAEMIDNPRAVQQLLEAQPLLQNLFNVSVLAVNSTGFGIANVPYLAERIGINYRDRAGAFAVALDEGRSHVGSPHIGLTTRQPLIPLAAPIRDSAGQVIGALGGAIDLSNPNFFDDLTAQGYGRTGSYSIISKSKRIVVTSSNPDLIMFVLPTAEINPVLDRALLGEEGTSIYTNEQGVETLATTRGLEITDWLVSVMIPVSEAFAPVRDMQRRMTLITLTVTLLVGVIIWWLLQRQLRPMLITVDTLGQMTESDQSMSPLPLTGSREVDSLIRAFNRLLERLSGREEDLRASEEALKHQNGLFSALLDNLPIGVFMVEAPSGKPLIANPAARELLGQGVLPDLSGEQLADVYRASRAGFATPYPQEEMPIIKGMQGEFSHIDDMVVARPDGSESRFEVFGTPVRNQHGDVWASLVSFYDISERKATEEENKRFKIIADNAVYGKAITDLEGNLTYINKFFAELHGYASTDLIGKNLAIFHTAEQLENVDITIRQLFEDGYFSPREVWHVHRDGSEFPMLMSGVLIQDEAGNPKYLASTAVDISVRKAAEQELKQKNDELEKFVYIVSHDLKSPLITINTFLGMLQEDIRDNNTEGITEDLDFIRQAAGKMESLLNALLKLSRIGRIDSALQTQPVSKLIDDCLHILSGSLRQRQVAVAVGEMSHQWHGDPLHFGQIWQNLIENAIKYMGEQLQPQIEIGVQETAGETLFYVKDNGIGIASEHHRRIFNMFAQLDRSSAGTGLGLALVKKIVTTYQGNIWVESGGKGKGSCFCFTLPMAYSSRVFEPEEGTT